MPPMRCARGTQRTATASTQRCPRYHQTLPPWPWPRPALPSASPATGPAAACVEGWLCCIQAERSKVRDSEAPSGSSSEQCGASAAVPRPLGGRRCRREAYRAARWGGIAPSAAGTGAARGAARGVRGIGGAARAGNGSATRTAGETAAHAAANATESANGAAKARPTRSKRLCVLSLVEGSPHTQQRSLPHTRGKRNRVQCGTELRSLFPGQRTAKASTRTLSSHAAASIYATAVKPTADVDAPCV